jgi:5-methyltetrahydropteroyltriglutamate--homocysteine methyltransferase
MSIPTEPVGSIPRPQKLIDAIASHAAGQLPTEKLAGFYDDAVRETIRRFEETGSPVISDGEQTKPSFVTYPVSGATNLAPDGVEIPFADGHSRYLPRLVEGPYQYSAHAADYLVEAKKHTSTPVKQAVIAASALSLSYPQGGIEGYPQEAFLDDLVREAASEIRGCLDAGAHVVQMDFTEGRLACKLDPSLGLLQSFVDLNNRVVAGFSDEDRTRIGIHTCPGGDFDSTHSADVDYSELLPDLFKVNVGNFYIQLASESDRRRVLEIIARHSRPDQRVFVGVIDPIDPKVETAEEVRDRVLEAAEFIPLERLGTTDDCGFAPFADDTSTARETAFAKIKARVEGTALAASQLGV